MSDATSSSDMDANPLRGKPASRAISAKALTNFA